MKVSAFDFSTAVKYKLRRDILEDPNANWDYILPEIQKETDSLSTKDFLYLIRLYGNVRAMPDEAAFRRRNSLMALCMFAVIWAMYYGIDLSFRWLITRESGTSFFISLIGCAIAIFVGYLMFGVPVVAKISHISYRPKFALKSTKFIAYGWGLVTVIGLWTEAPEYTTRVIVAALALSFFSWLVASNVVGGVHFMQNGEHLR